jgi:hypothetical protein
VVVVVESAGGTTTVTVFGGGVSDVQALKESTARQRAARTDFATVMDFNSCRLADGSIPAFQPI